MKLVHSDGVGCLGQSIQGKLVLNGPRHRHYYLRCYERHRQPHYGGYSATTNGGKAPPLPCTVHGTEFKSRLCTVPTLYKPLLMP